MQRGVVEVLLLSVGAGLLGTWIVLRGLAFFSHAVGTAAFPGLVLADGLGFSAALGAFGTAIAFAVGVRALAGPRTDYASLTAVVLAGFLAAGVILASDVFRSGASIESLLFGSLLVIGTGDLVLAAGASALVVLAGFVLGPRWLARGFDPAASRAIGLRSPVPDLVLLGLIALTTIATLSAIGALLASALIVVPAATVRLWTRRLRTWQAGSVALAAAEGVAGIWASVETNATPGATIAVISGGVFAAALIARHLPLPRGRRTAGVGAAAALLVLAASGCGSGGSGGGGSVGAVATTTQLGDLVRNVGGDRVDVHQILQPNTDPHDYEPRPDDVVATAGAAVVFTSGDGLDAWMGEVVSDGGGDPAVVDVGARLPVVLPGEDEGAEASRVDPHWWHDPRNAEAAVVTIREALVRADPGGAAVYAANATAYLAELRTLDRGIAACMASVPASTRKLVTDHDAFGYFTGRYGITVVGAVIPSQTTQAQPSAGDVARLTDLIRAEGVTAVFPESSLSPKLAEAIAAETGASAEYELYGDTLGPAGSAGATYLGMEHANADAMVRGFTGGARGCAIAGIG